MRGVLCTPPAAIAPRARALSNALALPHKARCCFPQRSSRSPATLHAHFPEAARTVPAAHLPPTCRPPAAQLPPTCRPPAAQARLQTLLAEEMARRERMGERERRLLAAKQTIVEEHLTWKCPRPDCRQAFFDFQGCTALECSRCPCHFCGWCLQDCGGDAHDHVRQCPAKPPDCDVFYPRPLERFNRHWRERKAALVRETLCDALRDDEERAEVREALAEHLVEFRDLL